MDRRLVIVESPAKARTVAHLLGQSHVVRAFTGPPRELPKGRLGIDVTRGFTAEWEVPRGRRRALAELRAAVAEADTVFLAADPDREGEAFCWHLLEELSGRGRTVRFLRVELHEMTARGVAAAFSAARPVQRRRVDAQQARLLLDRLVSDSVSPLLPPAARPFSGGVPWLALRLVCDRERAIEGSSPAERWGVRARLAAAGRAAFAATLVFDSGQEAKTRSAAEAARSFLETAAFRVLAVKVEERRHAPPPAFVTSTLLQEAFRSLRFPVSKTTRLARRLYEGVPLAGEGPAGLITFVRTDSPQVAEHATIAAREHIARVFGEGFVPTVAQRHGSPVTTPGTREAIRPTEVERTRESLVPYLGKDELALYALIWSRFVASQMAPAVSDDTVVELEARSTERSGERHRLRTKGTSPRFNGFLDAYDAQADHVVGAEGRSDPTGPLPPLAEGEGLSLVAVEVDHEFVGPSTRFSEAALVDELERAGVARAATYASLLATLCSRDFVRRARDGRLRPTRLGLAVSDLLGARLPDLASVARTATIEATIDAIEEGRNNILSALDTLWKTLQRDLASARRGDGSAGTPRVPHDGAMRRGAQAVEGACPECGGRLVHREGRYGPLVGCDRYPACRYLQKKVAKTVGLACPLCHEGEVVERAGLRNRTFYGCSRYPACRFTSHHRPVAESCPDCGRPYLLERASQREGRVVFCGNEACSRHRAR